jgi:hypothetical protein
MDSLPDRLELVPVTLAQARRFVAEHHRHNKPPVTWRVGVGLARAGELVGVGILGTPVARKLAQAEPRTIEITRVCTVGDKNANSRLYGALCRAAAALGYTAAITYTLEEESGASLLAAGFVSEGLATTRPGQTWNMPTRPRVELNLLGEETTPPGPKIRWRRSLA